MKKLLVVLMPMLLLLGACELFNKDAKPKLPAATTEGKHTFGCLVNGKVFINERTNFFSGAGTFAQLQTSGDTVGVNIYAESKTNGGITISFYDQPSLQVGKLYNLTDTSFHIQYDKRVDTYVCFYESAISGSIKLSRFDLTNNVISGTFEFKAYSPACQDTVAITEGRFDIGEINR